MQCTPRLLARPGFWKRSLDEFKSAANMGTYELLYFLTFLTYRIAIRLEGLTTPTRPLPLVTFDSPSSLEAVKLMSDNDIGGFSKASLTHETLSDTSTTLPHARFTGNISLDLPPNRPDVQRSGYAAWRTRDRGRTLFGRSYIDLDAYRFLALRVKSDGRKYFVNLQTESIVPTDLHQHRLHAHDTGAWETVVLSVREFVRTNYGMPVEPIREMLRQKITSVGIGLTDRTPGPFDLRIAEIYATNNADGSKMATSEEHINHGFLGGELHAKINKDKDGNEKSLM